MILTYATFLDGKDIGIKETINAFVADNRYKKVDSFRADGLALREYINRGSELVLQDGPTQVLIKFDYNRDRLVITVDQTVKAFIEIFTNNNPLVTMIGYIIKEHDVSLCSFDLGSDGVIHTY